jgi:cytoskeleton protein RodZ
MASEAGAPTDRGTGARLRAAREKKGLTVLQAAEKLHVDARVLEALEAEDFAALGADVYVRGHMRRYAELVGESPSELQELYSGGLQAARPDLTRIPRAAPAAHSSALTLPALLAVVGVAIAGILWWALHLPGQRARDVLPAAAAPLGSPPAPAAPATVTPGEAPPGGALPTTSLRSAPPPPAGAAAQLQLNFTAASWVDISDASGHRLLHGLIAPGARSLSGAPPLRVVLGNSPAVALRLNGQPVSVNGLRHRDGSVRLLIDAGGRATAASARLAHGD